MAKGAGVTIGFEGEIGNLEQQISRILQDLNKFNREAAKTSASVKQSFAGISSASALLGRTLGSIGFGLVAKDILDTNRSMEALRAQLKAIEGDARGGQKAFKFIQDFASNTPFEIQGLTETFLKLRNFGLEPTSKVMQALTDQASKLGGSQETLSRITLALGQAWAKGRLQGQDTLQLIEAGVPVYKLLAEVTGKNTSELQDMSDKGELTRDVIGQLITKMGELAKGSNAAAMETLNGKISNLSDSWHKFEDVLLNDKSEGAIKSIVQAVTDSLNALSGQMDNSLEGQINKAQAKLVELETFRTHSPVGFVGIPLTDQRIQEQGAIVAALQRQKAIQDAADTEVQIKKDSAKAIEETNQWLYDMQSDDDKRQEKLAKKRIGGAKQEAEELDRILAGLRYAETSSTGYKSGATSTTGAKGAYQITGGFKKDAEKLLGYQIDPRNNQQAEAAVKVMVQQYLKDFDGNVAKAVLSFSGVGKGGVQKAVALGGDDYLKFAKMQRPEANVSPTEYLRRFQKGYDSAGDKTGLHGLNDFLAQNDKALKDAEEHALTYGEIVKGLETDIANNHLPELQRQITEEQSAAYKSLGLDVGNLTAAQASEKAAVGELVKAKYFDIEATKLQTAQAEEAKKGFTLKQDILDETKAIAEGIVTRDQYAEQLTKLADLHKKFVDGNKTSGISDTEFKAAAANLTDNFNKSVDAAKGATDEMSVYAQQAAKNMQDAFANFLFDPFKDGVSGLADNFATALRQMAAQYLSSQLFDYLKSGFGSASGGSSSGSGVDWGGVFSKVGSLFSAAAKDGYAFQGGNIIPFASGGIVGRATPFGMSGGRRGVMGEAGPEAIMPLRRDSQGRLGIAGGGQAVTIVQNMHFGNNADGNTVRKAAGQGAREAMSAISGTQRYR